jgi:hypothetical protein
VDCRLCSPALRGDEGGVARWTRVWPHRRPWRARCQTCLARANERRLSRHVCSKRARQ